MSTPLSTPLTEEVALQASIDAQTSQMEQALTQYQAMGAQLALYRQQLVFVQMAKDQTTRQNMQKTLANIDTEQGAIAASASSVPVVVHAPSVDPAQLVLLR